MVAAVGAVAVVLVGLVRARACYARARPQSEKDATIAHTIALALTEIDTDGSRTITFEVRPRARRDRLTSTHTQVHCAHIPTCTCKPSQKTALRVRCSGLTRTDRGDALLRCVCDARAHYSHTHTHPTIARGRNFCRRSGQDHSFCPSTLARTSSDHAKACMIF